MPYAGRNRVMKRGSPTVATYQGHHFFRFIASLIWVTVSAETGIRKIVNEFASTRI
jgi:hypothetical protein